MNLTACRCGRSSGQGRSQGISVLAVDAIDDEPYISSQLCPAIQLGDQMAGGARLAQKALGAQESFVAIYKHLMDVETKNPPGDRWTPRPPDHRGLPCGIPGEPTVAG